MKVRNKVKFLPVTITFETNKEVEDFWDAIEAAIEDARLDKDQRRILIDISNAFTDRKVI